jgi:uncharacterized protein HemX
MRIRTVLLLLCIGLLAVFAALNWSAFVTPTSLSLGIATVEAPLGLVLLAIVGAMALAFIAYMAVWQGTVLADARRHARELQAQRELADRAEASRFTELRGVIEQQLERLSGRIEQSQEGLRAEIREGINSLAAMIGELDDRTRRRVVSGEP